MRKLVRKHNLDNLILNFLIAFLNVHFACGKLMFLSGGFIS